MDFPISKEIVGKTTKCRKDCICLSNGYQTICPPVNNIAGQVLFVKIRTRDHSCNYKMSFGNSYVCTCPVRKEIHKRYKI